MQVLGSNGILQIATEQKNMSLVPFKTIYDRSTALHMSLSSMESGSLAKDKEVLDYCTFEVNVRQRAYQI